MGKKEKPVGKRRGDEINPEGSGEGARERDGSRRRRRERFREAGDFGGSREGYIEWSEEYSELREGRGEWRGDIEGDFSETVTRFVESRGDSAFCGADDFDDELDDLDDEVEGIPYIDDFGDCAEACDGGGDGGVEDDWECRGPSAGRGHNKEVGRRGEHAAARYLELFDMEILEMNWTCPAGEADIVAWDNNYDALVFVEVKTRTNINKGYPAEAVDACKRARYEKIAAWYLHEHDYSDTRIRFDVVDLLVVAKDRAMVKHIVDAFGCA